MVGAASADRNQELISFDLNDLPQGTESSSKERTRKKWQAKVANKNRCIAVSVKKTGHGFRTLDCTRKSRYSEYL
jgi:hypothetical protein